MANTIDQTRYVQKEIKDLIAHLQTELEYALPCYEDGTLSPRRALQHIKDKLELINDKIAPLKYIIITNCTSSTQPPATPEAL